MADQVVLDSSALMALLRGEQGAQYVHLALGRSCISTVNIAEVQTKLVGAGLDDDSAWLHIASAGCDTIPFDDNLARMAGSLVRVTKPFGLSLGDRACLALAIQRKATALTTDRAWKNLNLGIEIEVIR